MNPAFSALVETFLFISLYIQVFLIIALVEHRDKLKKKPASQALTSAELPTVSVIVPCFNEEETVIGTIESLKQLNYPKEKLSIIAVDDGSTDDTWSYLLKYQNDPQGQTAPARRTASKHSAVNYGIAFLTVRATSSAASMLIPSSTRKRCCAWSPISKIR